jgi:hypothetical protein
MRQLRRNSHCVRVLPEQSLPNAIPSFTPQPMAKRQQRQTPRRVEFSRATSRIAFTCSRESAFGATLIAIIEFEFPFAFGFGSPRLSHVTFRNLCQPQRAARIYREGTYLRGEVVGGGPCRGSFASDRLPRRFAISVVGTFAFSVSAFTRLVAIRRFRSMAYGPSCCAGQQEHQKRRVRKVGRMLD